MLEYENFINKFSNIKSDIVQLNDEINEMET